MKIAFLISSLEPGRDGVGDYTRMLAQECVRQGHPGQVIALHDRHLMAGTREKGGMANGAIAELRLSAASPWPVRIAAAQRTLDAFEPDWVSLQLVPYGFHDRGIVRDLWRYLPSLTARAPRAHVMFHEIWIGSAARSACKERLLGSVQRRYVCRLYRQLQPAMAHTSNRAYRAVLDRFALQTRLMPLFGNIPICDGNGDAWLFPELQAAGLPIGAANRDDFWLFGFFGSLYPNWPPEPLLAALQRALERVGRRGALISIGGLRAGEALWEAMARAYSDRFCFLKLGMQSVERVSQCLHSLDFGISATPYSLIGKSSTVAAMRDHGLPVIVNRDDVQFETALSSSSEEEALLHRLDDCLEERLVAGIPRLPACPRLPAVAGQFLRDLTECADR
jgi:hypothetical protein